MILLLCFLIGLVAGLRTMTALAATSWAAYGGQLPVGDTWLAVLGYRWTPWIATVLALGEFVTDMLPATPSRTVPVQFGGRIVIGAICGAAFGTAAGSMLLGAVAGVVGAVVGTLGGSAARGKLSSAFGRDRPAAILEDGVAVIAALLIIALLP